MLNYQFDQKSWNQQILLAPIAASTQYIVKNSTYSSGALPINGSSIATTSNATMPSVENVKIPSAGNDSALIWTVYGTDENDQVIVDTFAGANAGTATSNLKFKVLYSVTPSINTAGNVTVGDATTANGACLSQTGTVNTPLNFNGAWKSGEFFNLNPTFITVTSAADESTNSITVTAYDESGKGYTTTAALANAGTIIIALAARHIVQGDLILKNNAAGNISVGINGSGGPGGQPVTATPWLPLDGKRSVDSNGLFVFLSSGATLNYSVQYTNDPILGKDKGFATPPSNIINDATLVSQTTTNSAGLNNPAGAVRLLINSFTSGTALFQLVQQGDFTAAPPAI